MPGTPPLVGLTIGDPAGVGPEITLKALADPEVAGLQRAVVIGDRNVLEPVIAGCKLDLELRPIEDPRDATTDPTVVDLIDLGNVPGDMRHGQVDPRCGRAAVEYIEAACKLIERGQIDGLVTGPINKEALKASGSPYPGHTEMLAALLEVPERDVVTMFVVERLRIFFLTRHHSLRAAIDLLDVDLVHTAALRVNELMRQLGYARPRLALAALNPHAGENRLLGDEELDILEPALALTRAEGVEIVGPVPADSVFWQGRQGGHDAVLSLYHDQGHIAAKTVSFFGTVSCTLGLPAIRTSAEHGTAFDIAGRWIANPEGQVGCMRVAADLAPKLGAVRTGA